MEMGQKEISHLENKKEAWKRQSFAVRKLCSSNRPHLRKQKRNKHGGRQELQGLGGSRRVSWSLLNSTQGSLHISRQLKTLTEDRQGRGSSFWIESP